jgi:ligand-binding SRPBCC domain-containing protein
MSYTQRLHVEAPVEKVFEFFRDPANWNRLTDGEVVYKDVRRTPEGLGTSYTWSTRLAGVPIEGFNVFTEFVPDRRITDRCSRSFEGTWTYAFEPEGSGTRITLANQAGRPWTLPVLSRLMDWVTARTHEPVMARFKALMEASAR